MMLRHKASFLHTAYEHPCPQHMEPRLRKGHRQQHTAAVHHSRALRQRGEILPGKLLPCGKALRRGGLPCPGVPGAAARALHGIPAGAAVRTAGAAGICGLGGLCLALAFFARLGSGGKPELLLRGVFPLRRQGAGRAGLDQPGHKMPLAALTGPDAAHLAHVQRQTAGAVLLACAAKGVVHVAQHIGQCKLRVALQKGRYLPFVLLRRKGTGGVHQLPAGCQCRRGAVQNLCAQLCTLLYQCLAVLLQRYRLLAEHSLAGAGRVHQHPVEKLRQCLGNAGGGLVEHYGVGNAHALKIAF